MLEPRARAGVADGTVLPQSLDAGLSPSVVARLDWRVPRPTARLVLEQPQVVPRVGPRTRLHLAV